MSDSVDNPKHYKVGDQGKEAIELIKDALSFEQYIGFLEGNVFKYMYRYKNKNGVEDLKKAKKYIDFIIAEYGEQDEH